MRKNLVLVLLLGIFLISFISFASAVVPFTPQEKGGLSIEFQKIASLKQGEDHHFHFHVFNETNFIMNDTGECKLTLTDEKGNHLVYNQNLLYEEMSENGWGINISAGNFTTNGEYSLIVKCNTSTNQIGFLSFGFDVTTNGHHLPSSSVIVFYSLIFIIIIVGLLSILLYSIFHFIALDFDAKDLIINISSYFGVFAFYILSQEYLGNKFINDFLLFLIEVGSVTTVIIPIVAFVVCFIKSGLELKNMDHY